MFTFFLLCVPKGPLSQGRMVRQNGQMPTVRSGIPSSLVPVVAACHRRNADVAVHGTLGNHPVRTQWNGPSSMWDTTGATTASTDKTRRRRKISPVLTLSLIFVAVLLPVLLAGGIWTALRLGKRGEQFALKAAIEQRQAVGAKPPPPQPTKPQLLHSIPWLVAEQSFHAHVYTRISSDGRLLMAVRRYRSKGRLSASGNWPPASKFENSSWAASRGSITRSFSPRSKQLITSYSSKKDLYLWDIEAAKVVRTFIGHTQPGLDFAVSPDGKRLGSSWSDDKAVQLVEYRNRR